MFAFLPEISFFDWKSSVCLQDGSQSCGTTEESGEGDGRQEEGRQGTAPSQEEENQVQPIWNNDSFEKLNETFQYIFLFQNVCSLLPTQDIQAGPSAQVSPVFIRL